MKIATMRDIEALEARGYEAVYPHASPHALLRAAAERSPQADAIRFLTDLDDPARDIVLSHGDLLARVEAAGSLFRQMGVGPDRAVAILGPHTPSAQIALWGAQLAGRACPINPMLRPDHVAALLDAAGVAVVLVMGVNGDQDIWSALVPGLRAAGVTLPILDFEAEAPCPGSDGRFEEMIAPLVGAPLPVAPEGGDDALAAFYHTGGTTGAPKLVRHTRRNEAHVARSCALMHDLQPDDVVLNGFPLFHVAGAFVYGLSTLSAGGCLLIPGRLGMRNRPFVETIWRQVERHRISILGVVPTVLSALNAVPIDADISSLRAALTGGSPLPPELADAFERKTGVPLRNILGMTESAGTIAVEPVHGPRTPNSCGLRMPFSEVIVAADRNGEADLSRPLPVGETGIIALRGPNVSPGYTDPARGRETFPGAGWLVSGDLGRLDEEGRLFVTGRAKDVIIRGGHNIDPQAIEDALLAHPQVQDAAAIGMPDAYAGELPVAFVTLHKGSELAGPDLIDFLRPRIDEPAALPKRIEIIEQMPVTPIGKIFKPALRRIAAEWALRAAAAAAGVPAHALAIEIGESLGARVTLPAEHVGALRERLSGMPMTIEMEADGGPGA